MDHVTVTGNHNRANSMAENNIENTDIKGKPEEEKSEPSYEKLKCSISVKDFLAESQSDQDIELRSSRCGGAVRANRIVLAAVSPFFKKCLADAVPESGQITVTITDCCYESLTYVMHYIHNGAVTTADQVMKEKVESLISRLQIGDFSISHLEKFEPLVKCEPSWDPDNAVDNYYNYINKINQHNESQTLKRKKKLDSEWKSQVISSLYKDDVEDEEMEDEDFEEEAAGEEEEEYYSDEEEEEVEYERKPKSKPKSGSSGKKYGCKSCSSKFSSQERLDSHLERKHSTERLKCEHCPKTFSRASDKRVHEEVHSKPYKCDQCEASFGRKSNLIGHLR